ncbi:MAG: tetratricopeptide repeat protein [Gallionella sp.]|nr:tetratricopeptide repeat protein [Gallionella sp.]
MKHIKIKALAFALVFASTSAHAAVTVCLWQPGYNTPESCNTSLATNNTRIWQSNYTLEKSGQYALAVAGMDEVLRQIPTHEFALMRRAWLNYSQGRHNDALRDYNQVLALNPKALDARLGITLPLLAQQRWREAAVEANKVIAVSAWDYTAHVRLMICEEGEHKWETLTRHATELATRYPGDVTAQVYLARSAAWQNDIPSARFAYLKVLQHVPDHIEANAYLKKNP